MNTILRKSILGIAGLAFTGGVFAGPVAAHAAESAKPAAVAVQAASPQGERRSAGRATVSAVPAVPPSAQLYRAEGRARTWTAVPAVR